MTKQAETALPVAEILEEMAMQCFRRQARASTGSTSGYIWFFQSAVLLMVAGCGMEQVPEFQNSGTTDFLTKSAKITDSDVEKKSPERVLVVVKAVVSSPEKAETSEVLPATVKLSSPSEKRGVNPDKQQPGGNSRNPVVITVPEAPPQGHRKFYNIVSYVQAAETSLDILWVIDSSASMEYVQEAVGANFNSFRSGLSEDAVRFQMAVTTTDICTDDFKKGEDPHG